MQSSRKIRGVSIDFYQTLVHPAGTMSRGEKYHQYLAEHGLSADSWEHKVLYDVFEYYGAAYHPSLSPSAKTLFWVEFTRRLFARTGVVDGKPERHAGAIRRIFGVDHFALFPEVQVVLPRLRQLGLRLAIVSNWQKGLSFFCQELGILGWFDTVVCSAEFGVEKPDRKIFEEAVTRLGLEPGEVLHVGDTIAEDGVGARNAGLQFVWLDREEVGGFDPSIRDLRGIERFLK